MRYFSSGKINSIIQTFLAWLIFRGTIDKVRTAFLCHFLQNICDLIHCTAYCHKRKILLNINTQNIFMSAGVLISYFTPQSIKTWEAIFVILLFFFLQNPWSLIDLKQKFAFRPMIS